MGKYIEKMRARETVTQHEQIPARGLSHVRSDIMYLCACVFPVSAFDRLIMLVQLLYLVLNTTTAPDSSCPRLVTRQEWGALPPRSPVALSTPVPYVVIHHTYQPPLCTTRATCCAAMRNMQRYHQEERGWSDIGYNFAIGGDGAVYEGRGWGKVGAHAPHYNSKSVGVAFIGDFTASVPTPAMLEAARQLLSCAVAWSEVAPDYRMLGHRQVRDTECPGEALYDLIQRWPHWYPEPSPPPGN